MTRSIKKAFSALRSRLISHEIQFLPFEHKKDFENEMRWKIITISFYVGWEVVKKKQTEQRTGECE